MLARRIFLKSVAGSLLALRLAVGRLAKAGDCIYVCNDWEEDDDGDPYCAEGYWDCPVAAPPTSDPGNTNSGTTTTTTPTTTDPDDQGDPTDAVDSATGGRTPVGSLVYNATGDMGASTDGISFTFATMGGDSLSGVGLSGDVGGLGSLSQASTGRGNNDSTSTGPSGAGASVAPSYSSDAPQSAIQGDRIGDYRADAIDQDSQAAHLMKGPDWIAKAIGHAIPEYIGAGFDIGLGTNVKSTSGLGIAVEGTARIGLSIGSFMAQNALQEEIVAAIGFETVGEAFAVGLLFGGPIGGVVVGGTAALAIVGAPAVAGLLMDLAGDTLVDTAMEIPEAYENAVNAGENLEQNLIHYDDPFSGPILMQ